MTLRHQIRYLDKIGCCIWKKIQLLFLANASVICNAFAIDSSDYKKTIFSALIKDVKTARLI